VRRSGEQLACSHKSHRRCFFLFSDAFSRTRTQRGSPRADLLQLQHERRYRGPVLATADVRCGSLFTYYRVSSPRATPCVTCRVWFVDIFIIPPAGDGSTHRADYANVTPHSQRFFLTFAREENSREETSVNNRGYVARVKVQCRISEER